MDIGTIGFDPYISSVGRSSPVQSGQGQGQQIQSIPKNGERDSYIPSMSAMAADMAIPTSNYNARGVMEEDFLPVSATGTDSSSNTDYNVMDILSHSFRANQDSIQSTLDDLGLSIEDLALDDNMMDFAEAMNKQAENIGVPQVENLGETAEKAMELIKAVTENEESGTASDYTLGEEDLVNSGLDAVNGKDKPQAPGGGGNGSGASGSSGNDSSKIVEIAGELFMETTTIKNGMITTTRTKVGEA
ncbi:MAG: hypothetical protein K6A23_06505 [Butyrivibrio sp.]|nr:hypothetical protein [Butyrivibrio sp.]